MIRSISILFLIIFLAGGCSKEHLQGADCSKLKEAILAGHPDDVENEINKICASLTQTSDSKNDLDRLNIAITKQCEIKTIVSCYNCIYTSPAQSEIKISISSSGIKKDKIIDISFDGSKFVFAGMHD